MAENILVVDDDTLMRPSLALVLERTRSGKSRVASAQVRTLIRDYPPEVIFLTARRAKVDQVLRSELGAKDRVTKLAITAHHAPAAARWRRVLAPAAFAVGMVLLVLAAPHWIGWMQHVATSELPTVDMAWSWLTHLLFDPVTTFDSLLSQAVQAWLNPGGQMDALTTLTIIVLAGASVAELAQLLGVGHVETTCGSDGPVHPMAAMARGQPLANQPDTV